MRLLLLFDVQVRPEPCRDNKLFKHFLPSEQTAARADALAGGDADPEAGAGPGLGVPPPPGDHGGFRALPLQDTGGVPRTGNYNIDY